MDPRPVYYRHPYAAIVTGVFLLTSLVTGLYFFGVIPGVRNTQRGMAELTMITFVLLAATAVSWITAMLLSD